MIYPENISIFDVVSSLPGIVDTSSNINTFHKNLNTPLMIFFGVEEKNHIGLFLLTRCIDKRYWEYGHLWSIRLLISDHYDERLPITYVLSSDNIFNSEAIYQSISLIENINEHLENKNFLDYYNIDKICFEKSYLSYSRSNKLKKINKK